MTDGLHIEVTLPAPVDEVWPVFREPDLIRRWFGWEYDELDAEIRQVFADGTAVEPDGRSLHIGGHRFTFEPAGTAVDRSVARGLAPLTQTIVRVTRATPLSSEGMDWDAWYDDVDEGWLTFLEQLRFTVTHHRDDVRHTVHLDGEAPEPTSVSAALGLDVAGDAADRYEATVAGEELTGEVWFRSTHQLGLTVDTWGPGLLVLAEAPNGGGRTASVTLTTYGSIDGDRQARWTGIWRATYAG